MAEARYAKAINQALFDAMAEDPTVILMGEDVGSAGGPFGVSRGLLDKFGPMRVRDTPISEAGIAGAAVGAALSGLKPILEIMFMDFTALAMDAIVNQAAKARFMYGGQVAMPLVIRTQHGGGQSAGPQHSQCLEAWFAHVPGLKVVCPYTVADAYGLMRAAIRDPNPVVFIENKTLYAAKGDLPANPASEILGSARTIRTGSDVTLVSYGAAVGTCLAAADALAAQGATVEVIDLRTLQPWDEQHVLESLARTHRLVIVHEAVEQFGVGAEIAARMVDISFDELDAPIIRVGAPFAPVPFAPAMEADYIPNIERVVAAVRRTLA